MEPSFLDQISEEQAQLATSERLLNAQEIQQRVMTQEMIANSKNLISELHLLSLVRKTIIAKKCDKTIDQIVNLESFKGLYKASLEYCPDFLEPNQLNGYLFLCTQLRREPEAAARVFYEAALEKPKSALHLAYSTFLSLFQQGWCYEEDMKMSQILQKMANMQAEETRSINWSVEYRPLKQTLSAADVAVSKLQPFVSFSTAYLFNSASYSYLQSSLSPIIIKLDSLSSLYNIRSEFSSEPTTRQIGTFEYWNQILNYSIKVLKSLEACFPLLPLGVSEFIRSLLKFPKNTIDPLLIFFESFINRALDEPSVLGLVPWHPSHGDWHPAHDIAQVFRTRYVALLPSHSLIPLLKILHRSPQYANVDLKGFIEKLANYNVNHDQESPLMSES